MEEWAKVRRIDQVILHLAVGANTVGIGVILALLADLQDAYQFPTYGLGIIAGSSFVTAFVGFIFFSGYADRGHAKLMLALGTAGGVVALVAAAFASGLWTFVFARALLGLAEGVFVPAARRVVLDWQPGKPGEVLGRILAAGVAGFALGPVIGATLASRYGLHVPFLVPAFVLLLAVPVILRVRPNQPEEGSVGRGSMLGLVRSRLVVAGLVLSIVEFGAIGLLDALWARLLADLDASTIFIGATFTAMAIPMVFLSPRFGRLIDRTSAGPIVALAALMVLPPLLVYGFATSPWVLAGAAIVHAAGSSALAPAAAALVAKGSPSHMLARGQGLLEATGFLGAAATSFPAGLAYATIGRGSLMSITVVTFVVLMGVGLLLARTETKI